MTDPTAGAAAPGPCCAARILPEAAPVPGGPADEVPRNPRSTKGQALLPGGAFTMGDHFDEGYPDDGEIPVHAVELRPFHIDETAVTNRAFARFVRATGYVTESERFGVSAVFHLAVEAGPEDILHRLDTTYWWVAVRGADWRHPEGPRSTIGERSNHPVVHVSWNDAAAYAAWAGKRLPTEAEWEYAARGGLTGQRYAWGDELTPRGEWRCNIWQGRFPDVNTCDDGHLTTAPVKSYRPNGYGLWGTAGNVWEWCADHFDPGYYAYTPRYDPRGPLEATGARVMRGGSFLCHDSYCNRYRVAARSANTPDSASANLGFRCANDA
ncbi:formylglycine-generating enzyme family protein [Tomitella fengzijianii]|uniref:formylglycine-generating enzyme family protein n=1 Tax=Tomitella fengzijianii TaxID=2597660 RepID=UPI00131B3DDD|nr:formylglycine-generating enzyme family protein [Tomitella fengzijianii]